MSGNIINLLGFRLIFKNVVFETTHIYIIQAYIVYIYMIHMYIDKNIYMTINKYIYMWLMFSIGSWTPGTIYLGCDFGKKKNWVSNFDFILRENKCITDMIVY